MLLIGGVGSGKFVSVLAHIMADTGRGKDQPPRYAILDPKGELAAVIGRGLVHQGAHVYCINPYPLHGLPDHSVALLAHLPLLVADSRRMARTPLPDSGGGEARFFEHKAQNWLDALLRGLVHLDGDVSLEQRIEKLEREKRILADRVENAVPPPGRLNEFIEPTLLFPASHWKIYEKYTFPLKRTVLKLAFA
ncbi:MAG: hypothetical protein QM682_06865 [Paracoccus sp. (in: a-proteobacteria)]|uniref:hypothetical protein n=1 Tax=Paracoccus sp. TaxID=267 RepID=UPI0039E6BFEB